MKIAKVDVLVMSFDHPPGHKWEKGEVSSEGWDQVVVQLTTDDGLVGIGESYHLKNPLAVAATVEHTFAPMLVGRSPYDVERIWQTLFARAQQLGSTAVGALAGVDTACFDLMGQALGVPVYQLLGGRTLDRVKVYAGGHVLGWRDPDNPAEMEDIVAEAQRYVDMGIRALKIRGGRALPHRGDLETVRVLREAFGDSIDILVDANNEYRDHDSSIRMARALDEYNIYWLEDCFAFSAAFHPQEMARLSAEAPMNIASGGNVFSRFGLQQLLNAGGVDVIMANTAKAGGISETKKIQALTSAANRKFSSHCDGGLNTLSNLHVFASAPPHTVDGMYFEWDPVWPLDQLLADPPVLRDGYVELPTTPGLGSALREGVLEDHPLKSGTWYTSSSTSR